MKASEQEKAKIRYALRKVSLTTVGTTPWRNRETRTLRQEPTTEMITT